MIKKLKLTLYKASNNKKAGYDNTKLVIKTADTNLKQNSRSSVKMIQLYPVFRIVTQN